MGSKNTPKNVVYLGKFTSRKDTILLNDTSAVVDSFCQIVFVLTIVQNF